MGIGRKKHLALVGRKLRKHKHC